MDESEILDELGDDVSELEQELGEVSEDEETGSLRQKHREAEELLEEIHGQLDFLKQVVEDNKE